MAFKTYAPTKAQQMRAVVARLQERDEEVPAPADVVAAMAAKGVWVSAGHANRVVHEFTRKRFSRCRRANKVAEKVATPASSSCGKPEWLDVAAKLVKVCGGFKQAKARLDEFELVVSAFQP